MSKKKPVSAKETEPSESTTPVSAPATDSVAVPAAESAATPATDAVVTQAAETAAPSEPDETPKPEASEPVSKIVPTAGSYPFVPNPAPVDGLTPHVRAVAEMGLGDVNPFD